jgi:hypothetical protein
MCGIHIHKVFFQHISRTWRMAIHSYSQERARSASPHCSVLFTKDMGDTLSSSWDSGRLFLEVLDSTVPKVLEIVP